MKRFRVFVTVTMIFVAGFACKEKYAPPEVTNAQQVLVVDGYINANGEATRIILSQSVRIYDSVQFNPIGTATVSVEGSDGSSWVLDYMGNGVYSRVLNPLSSSNTYRLRIRIVNNEYLSDDVRVKTAPPITDIPWERQPQGLRLFVNTQDDRDSSRYYRWEFKETWQFRTPYQTIFKYDSASKSIMIDPSPLIEQDCWQNDTSRQINIGTSANLAKDVIFRAPLHFIPEDSWKLSVKYSILVRQQVLPREAYEYLSLLKKNSEQLGTIFDPQPSTTRGNIRNLGNPEELVVGYVYASSVSEKRIFIDRGEVPDWRWREDCRLSFVANDSVSYFFNNSFYVPIDKAVAEWGTEGWSATDKYCVYCTLRGTKVKPPFWP